ncbi:MAG: NADH-quinone oxidoreductase subunit NuoE [Amaricoccus sp.]|uniref:NADH-quinone oxidoreductase subunit NuoE n=1 Tax=Amaricoccus sp. TaxID=1872485 RepID=UPI003314B2E3
MLRRLHPEQPDNFAFTPANLDWANGQIAKYPEGRQASAVIPLLWRAQEQEGWVSRPAIECIARMLDMSDIRVLEVATFYFMFQLRPVGTVAHVQVCGTTSCMICGAEDLVKVCKERIAPHAHELSPDGRFSWEEVECLGACANAPMAQVGKDYYEDLTAERLNDLLDLFVGGEVPRPGSQIGRFGSEPKGGPTSLRDGDMAEATNSSVTIATRLGDTISRITGDHPPRPLVEVGGARVARVAVMEPVAAVKPERLDAPRAEGPDDLKLIRGVGPKLEALLHQLGYYHFDQVAAWTPAEVAWVDENLEGFKGRVSRENWVEQARALTKAPK